MLEVPGGIGVDVFALGSVGAEGVVEGAIDVDACRFIWLGVKSTFCQKQTVFWGNRNIRFCLWLLLRGRDKFNFRLGVD